MLIVVPLGRTTRSLAIVLALFGLFAGTAQASTIQFWTGDTQESVTPGVVTPITPHGAWGDVSDNAGLAAGTAQWISYANTGIGGIVAPDISDPDNNGNNNDRFIGNQTALFSRTLLIGGAGDFDLWVLADDTATVVLNGPGGYSNTLFTASTQQVNPCAPGDSSDAGLGCVESSMGHASLTGLTGLYTLSVYGFQTNGDVFGIQYAGSYSASPGSPDPIPRSPCRSRCPWSCSGQAWWARSPASSAAGCSNKKARHSLECRALNSPKPAPGRQRLVRPR